MTTETKKIPLIRKKRHGMYDWFTMSEDNIFDTFSSLKDAKVVGTGDERFVFVPGTRDDRVLLVAHADTVWSEDVEVGYSNGVFKSLKKNVGIGADDRAGVAMLWQLKNMGHSILVPNAEESGCHGSRFLMKQKEWAKIINEHRFAIEMDRMDEFDMAFYDIASNKFKDWCEQQFPKYKRVRGIWTDVGVLCNPMCGMNISIGYYHQHNEDEILVMKQWENTLNNMRRVLSQKDLPRFVQDPKPPPYLPPIRNNNVANYHRREFDTYDDYFTRKSQPLLPFNEEEKCYNGKLDDIICCVHCEGTMDITEHRDNLDKCIFCQKEFAIS